LRLVTGRKACAENDDRMPDAVGDLQFQRRARIKVPYLDGIDAVPMRALASPQQEINRRRCGAAIQLKRIAERFAKLPAFGMRLQASRRMMSSAASMCAQLSLRGNT
jgi:hypothetical protein